MEQGSEDEVRLTDDERAAVRRSPETKRQALLLGALGLGLLAGLGVWALSPAASAEENQRAMKGLYRRATILTEQTEQTEQEPEQAEGAMGEQPSETPSNRYGIAGDDDDPAMARESAETAEEALPTLQALQGSWNGPTSPYGPDSAMGNDPMSAVGALMGDQVGSNFGFGGLGLRGTGRGGGGTGQATIGLGSMGTIGHGGGAIGRNGVLASNFVGGGGVRSRLDDLLERGVSIDGEMVRLEAFQDRARLRYPVPTNDAVALYAASERTSVHAEGDVVHLAITLVARRGELPRRPPMDVRLLLDRSGSMSGESWTHAVSAARRLVRSLRPNDRFGLVSYASEASLDVAPRRVGNRAAILRALSTLEPGGGTNIGAALELVAEQPPERGQDGVGLVVLLSDGDATDGIVDPQQLGAMSRRLFDEHGVLTTSIGVGTHFDEETMLTVAREGSGSYHFVRRPSDIGEILTDELETRAQAVAQALRVRVELSPGVVARRVYGSRLLGDAERAAVRQTELATDARIAEELGIEADRDDQEEGLRMHLPTFRRGDQHVILMELEVPRGAAGSIAGLARVHLDAKDLVHRTNLHQSEAVTAERVGDRSVAMRSVDRTVKRAVLAFQAGEALQGAASALESGNSEVALTLIRERRELLEHAAELWRDRRLRADASLLQRYERVVGGAWGGFGGDDRRTLVMAMGYFADQRMR